MYRTPIIAPRVLDQLDANQTRYDSRVRSGPVRFGPVRFGPVRFGPVRFGPVRFGLVWVPVFKLLDVNLNKIINLLN